jgi:menaquinone-dependent protoporphyrinogen IX oxidase
MVGGEVMVDKVLIAYTTKSGATQKTAEKIADVLRDKFNFWVDITNLREQSVPYAEEYSGIIVGTGVQKGKIYAETEFFLAKDFGKRPLAYFTCSGFIYPKTYEETVAAYTTNILATYPNFKPVATEAFGGYIKILGVPVPRKMDMAKVEAWADTVGTKFSE